MPSGIYKGNKGKIGIWRGKKLSEKHKKRMSISHEGKKLSEKHKTNIGNSCKGLNNWSKGRKLTKETKRKMGESRKGEKNPNWKGGISTENMKKRVSTEYRLWRIAVFERDNFICQKYGIKGGYLVAHHINNFAEKEELRFAIDNGIALSEKAHKEFHHKYGIKNNTKEQLEEFLTN